MCVHSSFHYLIYLDGVFILRNCEAIRDFIRRSSYSVVVVIATSVAVVVIVVDIDAAAAIVGIINTIVIVISKES